MTANELLPTRRSVRLDGYDYSQPGMYYVTVCAGGRKCLFGKVLDGGIVLTAIGEAVRRCWLAIPDHFPNVALDACVIMPNHVHGIITIEAKAVRTAVDQGFRQRRAWQAVRSIESCRDDEKDIRAWHASPLQEPRAGRPGKGTIGAIIGSFKSAAAREAKRIPGEASPDLWQRGYYEHIISSESGLNQIRRYIAENPANWSTDEENPSVSMMQERSRVRFIAP